MTINQDLYNNYGAIETNPIPSSDYHNIESEDISWDELRTFKNVIAERTRFVTNSGFPFWDLSYFHVRIDGVRYRVSNCPFDQIPKKNFKSNLYNILKEENIFIKNFFESISQLY